MGNMFKRNSILIIFQICLLSIFSWSSARAAQTSPELAVEIVATGLTQPVGAFTSPMDPTRLFVVEQGGAVRIIKNGVLLNSPFLDLTNQVFASGEEGMLSIAFHPQYAENRQFFVFYNRLPDMAMVVERYLVSTDNPDAADPSSALTFLVIPKPCKSHNGGMLAFSPIDGYLYISVGDSDSGGGPHQHSQNLNLHLGKMLRIGVNNSSGTLPYIIPHANPYYGDTPGLDEIFSIGLRNPWRFSFDRLNGDLYIADVGQERAEEVNVIKAGSFGGQNFGWSCVEGNECTDYFGGEHGCPCPSPIYTDPIHVYEHPVGCCIIGGYVYRGYNMLDLYGRYFFSDLCTKKTWSFKYDGSGAVDLINHSGNLQVPDGSHSIVSYGEDAFGELYYIYHSGEIARMMPASLEFAGVSPFGSGTPGCDGEQLLSVGAPAKIGMPNFYIRATNAPPNSLGLGFLTTTAQTGVDTFGLGFDLLVDLYNSSDVILYNMPTDENGRGFSVFEIPNNPSVVGTTYYAQSIFHWGQGCTERLPAGFSSTNGLTIVVQN
ncbi:MAG: PQQ-dependent sugar dehydrogenase [Planctomycetota bacterium]